MFRQLLEPPWPPNPPRAAVLVPDEAWPDVAFEPAEDDEDPKNEYPPLEPCPDPCQTERRQSCDGCPCGLLAARVWQARSLLLAK